MFDPGLLAAMLEGRYVKAQHHPEHGLRIYNYTQLAQFNRVWNPVTLQCRGLITDREGRIVARSFAKFFNLAEHPEASLPVEAVHVSEKLDGSLGILYPSSGGYAIATRGSFVSEQALHASTLWTARYAPTFTPNPRWTYLFEIIYPGNRVVVEYPDTDDLFLLGAVETATGRSVPLETARQGWPGPVVPEHPCTNLQEALTLPARSNTEGIVIHFPAADLRVKVKHEEYVRLHRIVTGVSERRIWEALAGGLDLGPWLEAVPDECFEFVTTTRDRLLRGHAALTAEIEARYSATLQRLGENWGRKEFAAEVAAQSDWPLAKALFLRLDNKPFEDLVWKAIRPQEHVPIWGRGEDES